MSTGLGRRDGWVRRVLLCLAVVAPVLVVVLLAGYLLRSDAPEEHGQSRKAPSALKPSRRAPDEAWYRVEDESGAPCAGVTIACWRGPLGSVGRYCEPAVLQDVGRPPPPPVPPDCAGITKADGTLVLERTPQDVGETLLLTAEPPLVYRTPPPPPRPKGPRPGRPPPPPLMRPPEPLGQATPYVYRLERGAPLDVRVVDAKGDGLQGYVRVQWPGRTDPGTPWGHQMLAWDRTDPEGRVRLLVPPDGTVRVDAYVPRVGLRFRLPVTLPHESPFVIPMAKAGGACVEGHVRTVGGAPLAGASVQLRARVADDVHGRGSWRGFAVSGADGSYRVEGLPTGDLKGSIVTCDGLLTALCVGDARPLQAGQTARLDVRLNRACSLLGHVHTPGGEPVAGALITTGYPYHHGRNYFRLAARSDAEGTFRLDGLPVGPVLLYVRRRGMHLAASHGGSAAIVEFETSGEEKVAAIEMVPGEVIEGRVVDRIGEPVVRAIVECGERGRDRIVFTDGTGGFRARNLRPGSYRVGARAAGVGWTRGTTVDSRAPPWVGEPVVLTLEPFARLQGQIVSADGSPTGRLRIQVGRRFPGLPFTVKGDGSFDIQDLPACTYRLLVLTEEGAGLVESEEVSLAAGEHRRGFLVRVPPTRHVRGIVVDDAGQPLAHLRVRLLHRTPVPGSKRTKTQDLCGVRSTDGHGRFDIEVVWPREGSVRVEASRRRVRRSAPVTGRSDEVRLVLPRPPAPGRSAVLEGHVRDPSGEPVLRGEVYVYEQRGKESVRVATAQVSDGGFGARLELVGTEVVVIVNSAFDAEGRKLEFAPCWRECVVPEDGPLEIRLDAGLPIRVCYLDDQRRGVPGLRVEVGQSLGPGLHGLSRKADGVTDAEGCLEVTGFGPGRASSKVRRKGRVPWLGSVRVTPGEQWNELCYIETPAEGPERPPSLRVGSWPLAGWLRERVQGVDAVFLGEVDPARATSVRILKDEPLTRYRSRILTYPRVASDAMRTALKAEGFDRIVLIMERVIPQDTLQKAVNAYTRDRLRSKLKETVFGLQGIAKWNDASGSPTRSSISSKDYYGWKQLPGRSSAIIVGYPGARRVALQGQARNSWMYREALAEYETLRILADAAVQCGVPLHVYSTNERKGKHVYRGRSGRVFESLQSHIMEGKPLVCLPARHASLTAPESLAARCAAYLKVLDAGSKHPKVIQVIEARRAPERAREPVTIRLYDGGRHP